MCTGRIVLRASACLTLIAINALVCVAPTAQATPATSVVAMPPSVTAAVLAAEDHATVAVAVLDTRTGVFYGSLKDDTLFPSESVVKVLIAAKLLATGNMTGSTEQMAYQMITESDDDDADALWGTVDGPAVISWAENRYHITDLGSAPTQYGWWGNTKFTARGLVELYANINADPQVGPWLINAMSHMAPAANDGTDQDFGLAAQTATGAFKQGWGGDDDDNNSEQLNSTGLLDSGRYAVALLVQHIPYEPMSQLLPVINAVAAAVIPSGQVAITPPPALAAPARPVAPEGGTAPTASAATSSQGIGGAARTPALIAASGTPSTSRWLRRIVPHLAATTLSAAVIMMLVGARRRRRQRT